MPDPPVDDPGAAWLVPRERMEPVTTPQTTPGAQAAPATPAFTLPERMTVRNIPALVIGGVLSLLILAAPAVMFLSMDAHARSQWSRSELGTIIALLLVIVVLVMSVGLSKVSVGPDGVRVRNLLFGHHYDFDEVETFTMSGGDPWLYLKLADTPEQEGDSRMVLAVQRAQGDVTEERIELLRAMIRKYKRR